MVSFLFFIKMCVNYSLNFIILNFALSPLYTCCVTKDFYKWFRLSYGHDFKSPTMIMRNSKSFNLMALCHVCKTTLYLLCVHLIVLHSRYGRWVTRWNQKKMRKNIVELNMNPNAKNWSPLFTLSKWRWNQR